MHMHRLKVSRNEGGLRVAGKEIPCMRGLIKVNDARAMRTTLRFAVPVAKLCYFFMLVILSGSLSQHAALKISVRCISMTIKKKKISLCM